jgi:ABC-2 type transport system permease protein
MAAEWTKLWSVRSTWWCLGAAVLLQGAYAVLLGVDSRADLEHDGTHHTLVLGDAGILSLQFAQYALVAMALLAITSEYSSGLIATTLRAVPLRGRALAAKTLVVAGVVGLVGLGLMLLAALAGWAGAGSYAEFPVGAYLRDALTMTAYAAILAAFTLGIGAALRSAVGGLTVVLVVAVVLPATLPALHLGAVSHVNDYLPGSASVALLYGSLTSPGPVHLPYGPGRGALVFAAWALVTFALGYLTLRRRDA